MSAWRGDVRPAELTRPEYARFVEPSRRTPEANPASRTGTVGDQAIEALDRMKSARKAG
jgi:hypothetical protein